MLKCNKSQIENHIDEVLDEINDNATKIRALQKDITSINEIDLDDKELRSYQRNKRDLEENETIHGILTKLFFSLIHAVTSGEETKSYRIEYNNFTKGI